MMKAFKYVGLLVILLIANIAFAQVDVRLSSTTAVADEEFSINFIYLGPERHFVPDFSPLEKDFTILSTAKSSHISVINGQVSSQTQWQLMLNANKAGHFTIPAIKFGNEYSKPITITITAQGKAKASDEDNNFFMQAEVDQKQPYVQQQITYKVKMFYRVQPNSAVFSPPSATGAILKPLADSRNYQTRVHGNLYHVVEQEYAIFPEKSGKLMIKSPVFKGLVPRSDISDVSQLMMNMHKKVRVAAPTIKLKVKPIPASFSGETWLPAKALKLSESWLDLKKKPKAGEPITRIIHVKAWGLLASQLPELKFDSIKGANVYAQPSKSSNKVSGTDVIGEKSFKIVYIPKGTDDLELPALKLTWWNTSSQKFEEATLAAKGIKISNKKVATQKNNTKPQVIDQVKTTEANERPIIEPNQQKAKSSQELLPWILVGILTLCIGGLLLRRELSSVKTKKSSKKDRAASRSVSRKTLKIACNSNEPLQAKKALLAWTNQQWPKQKTRQLMEIPFLNQSLKMLEAVQVLEKAIYGSEGNWDGNSLWLAFIEFEKLKAEHSNKKKDALPAFN